MPANATLGRWDEEDAEGVEDNPGNREPGGGTVEPQAYFDVLLISTQ